MTTYSYLLKKKESGELSILLQIGLPVHLINWMDYYAYSLHHPEASCVEISYRFHVTKSTIAKTPAGRWLEPEELGGPAVFLASHASDAVNGHVLYVDGGILAYIGKQPE